MKIYLVIETTYRQPKVHAFDTERKQWDCFAQLIVDHKADYGVVGYTVRGDEDDVRLEMQEVDVS